MANSISSRDIMNSKPFYDSIVKKNEKKVPYIVGITTDNSVADGLALYKCYKANGVSYCTDKKVEDIFFYTVNLGEENLTYLGRINEQDHAKRVFLDTFLKANEGNAIAQRKLGDLYSTGNGVNIDINEAKKYHELAANQENLDALNKKEPSLILKQGDEYISSKLTTEALACYVHVALTGNEEGIFKAGHLALMLGDISFQKNELVNAIKHYSLVLNIGHVLSDTKYKEICLRIGDCYLNSNPPKALQHYLLAANKGCPLCQYKVGELFTNGAEGIKINYLKAQEYFKLAAAQDHPLSMLMAATEHILGNRKNIEEATNLINRFTVLQFGKNLPALQSWLEEVRQAALYNKQFQYAIHRLYLQCNGLTPLTNVTNNSNHKEQSKAATTTSL